MSLLPSPTIHIWSYIILNSPDNPKIPLQNKNIFQLALYKWNNSSIYTFIKKEKRAYNQWTIRESVPQLIKAID